MADFLSIKKLFPTDQWDVGYISATQLKICAYSPIKYKFHSVCGGLDFTNGLYFKGLRNCIVLITQSSHAGDYSFYERVINIMNKSSFKKWRLVYTNFKEAAIQAGLGVKAKNSLVYSYRFGFDSKICAIGFDNKITNVPTNKRVNHKLWNRCVGCWDCAINCPVQAIHNKGNKMEGNWIDGEACNEFMGLSDHPRIPSVKKFWHENIYPELSKKEVTKLKTSSQVSKKYGAHHLGLPFDKNGYSRDVLSGARKDDKPINIPHCRECTSQPRCSKWNGAFPY